LGHIQIEIEALQTPIPRPFFLILDDGQVVVSFLLASWNDLDKCIRDIYHMLDSTPYCISYEVPLILYYIVGACPSKVLLNMLDWFNALMPLY